MNSKILVFATMAVGIFVAFFLGMAVGEESRVKIVAVFGLMVGAPLLLSLGKNYWYLIPASLLSGLPAIPIGGKTINLAELCIALCFAIFITRVAFKKDKIEFARATSVPIYLFMAWVLFIFCLYPVGMAAFGAAMMGGRFYAQLVMAFIAFLIVGSRTITEKDAKWIVFIILMGSFVNAAYNIASYFFFGAGDDLLGVPVSGDDFYTWHQSLGTPAVVFSFLLFAWKKPRDIFGFRNPGLSILYLLAIGLTLYSGKRMGLVAVFIAPAVGAIVYRQYSYLFLGGVAAIALFGAVIFGHGEYFKLPLQMQRTLSWLPADWDSQFRQMEGGQDTFRASLRRFAMENIKRDPIIGRGFGVQYSEIIGQISATRYRGGEDSQAAPYAIGRSWHNRWLGYAADFGIPLSIIQAILFLVVIVVAYKAQSLLPTPSALKILVLYVLIETVKDVVASHTSGHTATDAYERWWMYGIVFSIYASLTIKKRTQMLKQSDKNELAESLMGKNRRSLSR
jgi:hypothetical protein